MSSEYQEYKKSFDGIIEKIELLSIIDVYVQETGFSLNKNMMGACPFCDSGNHNSSNSDGAFKVYPSTNRAVCHACGTATGTVKMIMHIHDLSYKAAIHYIAKNYFDILLENPYEQVIFPNQKRTFNQRTKPTNEQLEKEAEERRKRFDYVKSLALDNPQKELAKGYLSGRGIDIEKVDGFYFQHEAYNNMPAGVVFFDSEKKLLNKRYITNNLPKGVGKTFNSGNLKNSVYDNSFIPEQEKLFLTEGVINSLSLFSLKESSIALFSTTNIIDNRNKFWKYFDQKEIIIAYDYDKSGMRSAIKLAHYILNNFRIESLKILIFPLEDERSMDVNDLLMTEKLKDHLENPFNYIELNNSIIESELEKINNDRDYWSFQEFKNYSYKKGKGKLTFRKKKEKIEEAENQLGISPIEKIVFNSNNYSHNFVSSEEFPIKLISTKEGKSLWMPNSVREIIHIEEPSTGLYGLERLKNEIAAMKEGEVGKKSTKVIQNVFLCFSVEDWISIRKTGKTGFFLFKKKLDYSVYTEELKPNVWKIFLLPANNSQEQYFAKKIAEKYIDIYTFRTPERFNNVSEYIDSFSGKDYIFFKQLNTALPLKFWEYEKNEVKLNLISFLYFIESLGYFSFQSSNGYEYISIKKKIVEKFDNKQEFVRHIRTVTNNWLASRGETIKIRNKILITGDFNERNLSQLREISPDFENSGKHFQNFFFTDGYLWHITKDRIIREHQSQSSKYIWKEDLIEAPSTLKKNPFEIIFSRKYQELLFSVNNSNSPEEKKKTKIRINNLSDLDKYDIIIHDKNNYFLQYMWLTSYIYWREAEKKDYILKLPDFWFELEKRKILSEAQIKEMKLHMINKISWLGYIIQDYRAPEHDYGLAILDAIDLKNESLKREAAGGGKSLIGKAISEIRRVFSVKANAEDFTADKHRYENYNGEKVMILDDMHKNSKIGDILTDFSNGITINPKHKRPIEIPLAESPKIIVTRNYIDMEGARVDRRLGRIFVSDFFHDAKGGKFKNARTPKTFYNRSLFFEDTPAEKNDLTIFFATCYQIHEKFGEINSPVDELVNFRIIKNIGEQLIEFFDVYFFEEEKFGLIDLKWFFDQFKIQYKESFTSYQRSKLYNSSSNFKKLIKLYCNLKDWIFNPEELQNKDGRIIRRSKYRNNSAGELISAEHVFVSKKENYEEVFEKMNEDKIPF